MSDQEEGHGHHAITREAVRQFFAARQDANHLIDGMTEDQYFTALDNAQRNQDVMTTVAGQEIPTYRTAAPAWDLPNAQREHGMADPYHDGRWNLDTDRQYVEDEVAAARGGDRMAHLGAAAHALEDSYSEAHAFRTGAADTGDPSAPVESFNVFDPIPGVHGFSYSGGVLTGVDETHDVRFDEVPVTGNPDLHGASIDGTHPVPLVHGTDRAAAAATAGMLISAHDAEDPALSDAQARARVDSTVSQYYQGAPGGVGVNIETDSAWEHERDRRLAEHQHEDAAAAAAAAAAASSAAAAAAAEPNMSVQPEPEPVASYDPAQSQPNASYEPAPEPNASYQPEPEPNASYDPGQSSSSSSSSSQSSQ